MKALPFVRLIFPYAICILLVIVWCAFNGAAFIGKIPFTEIGVAPVVPAEMIGRILGYIDAANLLALGWVFKEEVQRRSAERASDAQKPPGGVR